MDTISVAGLKSHLSEVLSKVSETGEPVVIGRYGVPMAKIVPYTEKKVSRVIGFGQHLKMASESDVQGQVDALLDDDTLSGFYP